MIKERDGDPHPRLSSTIPLPRFTPITRPSRCENTMSVSQYCYAPRLVEGEPVFDAVAKVLETDLCGRFQIVSE